MVPLAKFDISLKNSPPGLAPFWTESWQRFPPIFFSISLAPTNIVVRVHTSGGTRSWNLGGGHLRGNTHLGGSKIEFHEISPPPRCQNFWPPGFFSIHFFRKFLIFFQTFKNCPGLPKFFTDLPKFFPSPTKNVNFLATFHKFLQFCLSNSNVSTTFGHFSQKVVPLSVWILHPWLSATNGFYRNYQELGGGKMGGRK